MPKPESRQQDTSGQAALTPSRGTGAPPPLLARNRVQTPHRFDPAEIGIPVHVFHGRRDAIAPPTHALHWIETLADARPVWFEDVGHLLIEDHGEEILDRLAEGDLN